nr:hypothetical protein [Tanacetum cinerariifolium]GEW27754.1 hypothetical protein [Tanacetum cinerariifolium]
MVAYLTKSDASEGFNQVIDFLNGSYLKYALTVNLNIYVSCIKQFCNTIAIKQVNDVTRLQALVAKKKVVVTEAAIREVENSIFLSISLIAWRVGKGFFGVETPLFEGMLVGQEIKEEEDTGEHVKDVTASDDAQGDDTAAHGEVPTVTQEPSIPSSTLTIPPSQPPQDIPSTSQRVDTSDDTVRDDESNQGRMIDEMDKDDSVVLMDEKDEDKKVEETKVDESAQVQGRQAESQAKIYKTNMDHASKVLSMQDDEPAKVQEVVDVVTTAKLITKVVTTANSVAPSRRRKGVVIRDPKEESTTSSIISTETKSKDKGKGILVEEPKPLKKKQQIEMDEEYARKLHAEINKDIDRDVAIDHVKLKAKEDPAVQRYQVIKRNPQTEAQAQKNMVMYLKNVADFKLDYFKGMSYDDIQEENRALQSINETLAQKAAKRRKLNKEVEDLKRHLEIVSDEDDDVYFEATPLARKVPVVYCLSLEKSKDYTWSSKGQELEATGIMWCAYYNLYNHASDFVNKKKCCQAKLLLLDYAAEARLMLLSHINAAKEKLMQSRQS